MTLHDEVKGFEILAVYLVVLGKIFYCSRRCG
jgi:hypothetical protein